MPTINGISAQEGTKVPSRRTVPQPKGVRTPAEFLSLLRQLQRWSGLSLQELEDRTAKTPVLLPGGLAGMLGGGTLPRRELASAFIGACGCVPEVQAEWMNAYARVASPPSISDPRPPARPAAVLEPPVPPPSEKPRPEKPRPEKPRPGEPAERRRPRHRRSSGKRHRSGTRRSLSPLVAAPAFITVAVIAVAMFTALGDDSDTKENKHGGESPASPSPSTGWYFVQPETAVSTGNCLTILPDDKFKPTLSQDKCDDEDPLQHLRFETQPDGAYVVQGYTTEEQLWCLTLDKPDDGARLHLSACDSGNEGQRFNLEKAKPQGQTKAVKGSPPLPLFHLLSAQTRGKDMCVGIGSSPPTAAQAVHTTCNKSTIWGYVFVPTMAPADS